MRAPDLDAYVLCATARTGSTLLCGLLESSGVAGHPASYFNRRTLQEYADEWGVAQPRDGRIDGAFVEAALRTGRSANGVFGARVMAETRPELVADLAAASASGGSDLQLLAEQFGRLRFVHLRRRDVVAQAVSWARSLQTHYWHPGEAVLPGGHEPHYDEELIRRLIARIERLEAGWVTWFAEQRIDAVEVTYAELAADPSSTARRVLNRLGLDVAPGRHLASSQRRQADHLNADWIRRYRAR